MYLNGTVAAVYAFAIGLYTVRSLRYILKRKVCIMYGSCDIYCCEIYFYCTVAALYAVAKYLYTVR